MPDKGQGVREMPEGGGEEKASGGNATVFVSYASQDATVAHSVVAAMERAGLKCWIAPRDVTPGTLYADEIVRAINEAEVVVLVLSEQAVASPHVGKEIERASAKRRRIIALHTDSAPLTRAFEYFLSESQWIEAGLGGIEAATAKLVEATRRHLDPAGTAEPRIPAYAVAVSRAPPARRSKWIVAGSITIAFIALAYFVLDKLWLSKPVSAEQQATASAGVAIDNSIAVLPFTDMSEKKDQEYFADGMAEEVLDLLTKLPGLKVIGRTSSFQFKGKSEDLRTIGARLGAAYVVEGSVRKVGPRVRVTAQLIEARSAAHRWSESYDRDFGDILALQNAVATGIARALQLSVDADDARPLRQLANPEAYTLYLRGRLALDQVHLPQLSEAVRNFEQALALEPSFLRAAEALALAHVAQGFDENVLSHDAWRQAREAAERALSIDANSAPAHGVLGLVHAEDEFDWNAAQSEFDKALALNPRDPVTLYYAAIVASARGQVSDAERLFNASLAVDPLNPIAQQNLGQMLLVTGDFTGAEAAFRKSIAISAMYDGNHLFLCRVLLARGQIESAQKEIQAEPATDARDAGLAMIYHALRRKADSDAALARLIRASGDTWPYSVAIVLAYRGERDKAIEWLEKARESRDSDLLAGVRGDPELASLRGDARYKALLRRMNLPE
jgi:TolB-like protein/Flp pilus assembly protein TadD